MFGYKGKEGASGSEVSIVSHKSRNYEFFNLMEKLLTNSFCLRVLFLINPCYKHKINNINNPLFLEQFLLIKIIPVRFS